MTTINELTSNMTGRWMVTTRNGTKHIWDLDAQTYQRLHHGTNPMDYDNEVVQITRVERWPIVGERSYLFYDDIRDPNTIEQWRISSTIISIEPMEE